eukprot:scaffold875_cov183-Ochromonas_danica.AAC.1
MADLCNAQKLRSSALDFIAHNLKAVVENRDFSQHMDRQLLIDVLCRLSGVSSDTIDTQKEEEFLSVSPLSSDRPKKRKQMN